MRSSSRVVDAEVAQEVDLLERGAQGASAGHLDVGRFDHRGPGSPVLVQERPHAHEPDHLGGAVDVGLVAGAVVRVHGEVGAHRREERHGLGRRDPDPAGGPRERVDHEVRRVARAQRAVRLLLELVELGAGVVAAVGVDHLVGQPDQRVHRADVLLRTPSEQPGAQAERRRVRGEHGGAGACGGHVVEPQRPVPRLPHVSSVLVSSSDRPSTTPASLPAVRATRPTPAHVRSRSRSLVVAPPTAGRR